MGKGSAVRFLRIAATTALLVYVLHQAGLFSVQGWRDLIKIVTHAQLIWVLASLGMASLMNFSSSVKWYMLARSRGFDVPLWRLHSYYMVGKFFNLVLPSSFGGDFVRVHELGRYTGRHADATAVVFVERFSGLVTLVILALIAVVINLQVFNLPWLTIALGASTLGLGFICWLVLDGRPFNFVQKLCGERIPLLQKLLTKIGKFRKAVLDYQNDPGALWGALVNSLIFYFLAVINVWVSLLAFRADISFVSTLVAVPVLMFIMNLPFSIGGIGLMEFAYSFTLGLFGVPPTVALSTALLMRIKTLIDAGIGSALYPVVSGGVQSREEFSKEVIKEYRKQSNERQA